MRLGLKFIAMTWLLLAGCGTVRSSETVVGTILDLTDAGYATNILFTPLRTPLILRGTNMVASKTTNVTAGAGGWFSVKLVTGPYLVQIGNNKKDAFFISVPNDDLTNNITSLVTNELSFNYTYHPIYEQRVNKGQVGGYAGLDSAGHVPAGQLGTNATAGYYLYTDGTSSWWAASSGGVAGVSQAVLTATNLALIAYADLKAVSLSNAVAGAISRANQVGTDATNHVAVLRTAFLQASNGFILNSNFVQTLWADFNSVSNAHRALSNFVNLATTALSNVLANASYDLVNAGSINLTNALGVASGGTGRTNLTAGRLWAGNGTNALDEVIPGSGLSLSGSAGSTRTLTATASGSGLVYTNNVIDATNGTNVNINGYLGNLFTVHAYTNIFVAFTNITITNQFLLVNVEQPSNAMFSVTFNTSHNVRTNTQNPLIITSGTNTASRIKGEIDGTGTNLFLIVQTNLMPQFSTFGITNGGGGGASNAFLTGLVGYWTMDEASGTRNDSTANANHLTDSGSTASAVGKISNGADVEFATPTHLSHADNAALSLGSATDFTIACWVKMESDTGFETGIVLKDTDRSASGEFMLEYAASIDARFRFIVGNGTVLTNVSASNFGTPSVGSWCFIVTWHDSVAHTLNIQVNNGTANSTTWTGGTHDGTAPLVIGSLNDNANLCWDGVIDEVGYWKRTLSSAERTDLYNGGSGRTFTYFQ
jgi:hypothetical protein